MAARPAKTALNVLREQQPLTPERIDAFLAEHGSPIVEKDRATFLFRGEVDEIRVRHRVVGLPDPLPMRRIEGTDLWYATTLFPDGSRVEYQLEVRHGDHYERFNDPLNPKLAHSPFGPSSVCGVDYHPPEWIYPDPDARPGELITDTLASKALRRAQDVILYLPARFRREQNYPLLIVHDGRDYLDYASMKTVLDNLIHRLDVAPTIVAFVPPRDRLREYPNFAPHARFLTRELVPMLTEKLPLIDEPEARCLMGSSFGGIAALSTATRYPGVFGSLFIQSASLVFSELGQDHGGGPAFDPVVKFVNKYRARPTAPVERMFMTCGAYEPLITPNRAMAPVFADAGIEVKYHETRDGHNWENWRNQLQAGLSWIFPGEQKFVYE